jgi:hypothetical protein
LGFWVGSLLRPGDLAYPVADGSLGTLQFTQLNADIETMLAARIVGQKAAGIGDAFYLDSFGFAGVDVQTSGWLRSVCSADCRLFAEWCNPNISAYCGAYAEWWPPGQWLHYGPLLDVLKRRQPVIAKDRTGLTGYNILAAWGKKQSVAPLVFGQDIP